MHANKTYVLFSEGAREDFTTFLNQFIRMFGNVLGYWMPCFLENETQLAVDLFGWAGVSSTAGGDLTPFQNFIYSKY